jgi:hypothetical protein
MVTTVSDANGTTHFFDVGRQGAGLRAGGLSDADRRPCSLLPWSQQQLRPEVLHGVNPATRDLQPLLAGKPMLLVEPWGGQSPTSRRSQAD